MAYEVKENTGSLFKNKEQKTEKHPAYTGTINIGGQLWRQSAWINETKSGEKYFSQKFTLVEEKQSAQPRQRGEIGDDIPF